MQITIVVEDKTVYMDGKPLVLEGVDWSVFDLEPGNPLDDVKAVNFDTVDGTGNVEFKTIKTKQVTRPNVRPADWPIGTEDFEKNFAFVIPVYQARAEEVRLAEEAARAESERLAALEPTERASAVEQVILPDNLVTIEQAQAMADAAAQRAVAELAKTIAG